MNNNRFLFQNFSEAPTILDPRKVSSPGQGETLSKIFGCSDWPKTMLESRCCCQKTVLETDL
jgi:hypothetical protein